MSGIFSHILVAVDDSAASADAIAIGIRLAREHGGELTLCHAVNWLPTVAEIEATGAMVDATPIVDELKEAGRVLLDRAAESAKGAGVNAHQQLPEGEPCDAILDLARDSGCSLIVTGTHGRSGLKHLVLGSTTEAILRGSTIPVLTVRAGMKIGDKARAVTRIVVGLDDSEPSAAALAAVLSFPPEDLRHVLLCGVAGTAIVFGDAVYKEAVADDLREPVEHLVEAAVEKAKTQGVAAEGSVLSGNADSVLIAAAEQDGADLIVVGSHGRRGIRRYLLGSIAEAIVRTSPVPVLVVRTAATERASAVRAHAKSARV